MSGQPCQQSDGDGFDQKGASDDSDDDDLLTRARRWFIYRPLPDVDEPFGRFSRTANDLRENPVGTIVLMGLVMLGMYLMTHYVLNFGS